MEAGRYAVSMYRLVDRIFDIEVGRYFGTEVSKDRCAGSI